MELLTPDIFQVFFRLKGDRVVRICLTAVIIIVMISIGVDVFWEEYL